MQINKFKVIIAVLATVSLMSGPAIILGQPPGERVGASQYSLTRAQTPEFIVTGMQLDQLKAAHFADMSLISESIIGPGGRNWSLYDKDEEISVELSVAVYPTVAEAEDALLDWLNSVSIILDEGSRTGRTFGTHSWYAISPDGSGLIVFTHHNALIYIFASDYNLTESKAGSIVKDLNQGVNGAILGRKVLAPQIIEVDIPDRVILAERTPLSLSAEDPEKHMLSFTILSEKGQILKTNNYYELIYIANEAGTDSLKIYAINAVNVVSPVYIKTVTIEAKE